jgi:LuxR family maltose regulon positive regulatory protein
MPAASSSPDKRTLNLAEGGTRLAGTAVLPPGLVEAKLLIPARHAGTVRRSRLLRQLRSATDEPVISIVAPPGYGKTSLLVQMAAEDPRPVAWLTADDADNDPVVFLSYLATAIGRHMPLDPNIFAEIASGAVSNRAVVGRLLEAMAGHPVLVAIDDAHRITTAECLDPLAELIIYLPDSSQVVLAARAQADLPFSRWRADGSLLEIGSAELAMDEQEAAALNRGGLLLSTDVIRELTRQTGGWPALLALAALGARRSASPDAPIAASHDRLVAAYLRSELLERRSEEEVSFLTRVSVLDQLSGPLCDFVAERQDSAELLDRLALSTLLVDEYGGSYRFHTLLRDFLQAELAVREPGRVAELHRRAATWFGANGAADVAVNHAFAAADPELAATVLGKGMLGYHWSGRRATLLTSLRRFDDDHFGRFPWLAVLAAWEELAMGNVASTMHLSDIADRGTFADRPPDGTASFESGRAMLRAAVCRRGADDALLNATVAVESEAAGGSRWHDFALWQLAVARRMTGDHLGADEALDEAIAVSSSAHNAALRYCLLGHRALIAAERGDWVAAEAFADERAKAEGASGVDGYFSSAPAEAAWIRVMIERGDITAARRALARAMSLRPLLTAAYPALAVECLLAFARAHLALGDPAGARTLVDQADRIIRLRPDLGVLPGEVATLRASTGRLAPTRGGGTSSLTVMQLRVLAFLPYYLSFKEIGQRLGVTANTVRTHAVAIYGKLGASSRGEAVDLAVEAGLLDRFPFSSSISPTGGEVDPR